MNEVKAQSIPKKTRVRRPEPNHPERAFRVREVLLCGQTLTVPAAEAHATALAGAYHSKGTDRRLKQRANPDGTVTFTAVPRTAAIGRAWDAGKELSNVFGFANSGLAERVCFEIETLAAISPFDGRKAKVSKPFYTADANDIKAAIVRHWDLFRVFARWWDKNEVGTWHKLPDGERRYDHRTLSSADHPGVKLWREIALVDAVLRMEGKRLDDPATRTPAIERARRFLRHLNERWPIVGPFKAYEEWIDQQS